MTSHAGSQALRAGLVLGALGVVFGDIGTSPIYTLQTLFNPDDPHPVPISVNNVYGCVSLVFWSVMMIVTLTYVVLVMRADNDGEGGVMALITLIQRIGGRSSPKLIAVLSLLGLLGAALFFGDSMITPAISVLSAVEGLKVIDPKFADFVVPITAVIITGLFLVQRHGTATVGRYFGPVMALWFVVIGALGVHGIVEHPQILRALSPTYALSFMAGHFHIAFFALAAVVLSVTGAEALYADMGHFGRRAITFAWLGLALPALVLNYFGQGALLLGNQSVVEAPFFLLVPGWAQIPMIVLSTAATVIASQSVITGAYSVAAQAAQIGYLPRLRIAHTSESSIGQIYVPWINGMLWSAVIILVFAFRSSSALGYAYGMAVTGTITITTLLFLYVARVRWNAPIWLLILGGGALLGVDLLFLGANMTKLFHGAWLPLLIGLLAFAVLTTWRRGREIVTEIRDRSEGPLPDFIQKIDDGRPPLPRLPGTAIFLNRGSATAPLSMRANVDHIHVLQEHVVIVSVETMPVPRVSDDQRITVDDLGNPADGIFFVGIRYGYMERPDVPAALALVDPALTEGAIDLGNATYFLSKVDLVVGPAPTMAPWRKRLFVAISHMTADAAGFFGLPQDRTVIIGARIEV
ncbi:MAG TPA: KUP/HAK/KT family potassium transporter [Mycobacterium sp.]|nr:KUP/HAK/KT family potassium transporter [Mycobacterium sp.]HQC78571.1 KUP/HAK/KT family potassium transporter [Mycobacterium sp.]